MATAIAAAPPATSQVGSAPIRSNVADAHAGGGVREQRLQLIDGADRDVDLVAGSGLGIHAGWV